MKTITLSDLREWRRRKAEAITIRDFKRVGREFRDAFELDDLKGAEIIALLEDSPLALGVLGKIDFRSQP